jgi:hypothetical protein
MKNSETFARPWKLPAQIRAALPGKVISLYIVPLAPAYKGGCGARSGQKLFCFYHIGRLRAFRTARNFKLHFIACSKRFESIPRDSGEVNKHIISTGLFNKPKPFLCVEPFHKPFWQDDRPPLPKFLFAGFDITNGIGCQEFI